VRGGGEGAPEPEGGEQKSDFAVSRVEPRERERREHLHGGANCRQRKITFRGQRGSGEFAKWEKGGIPRIKKFFVLGI